MNFKEINFKEILETLDSEQIEEIKDLISVIEERNENKKVLRLLKECLKRTKNIRNSKPFINHFKDIEKIKFNDLTGLEDESDISNIIFSLYNEMYKEGGLSGDEANENGDLLTLPCIVSRCNKIVLSKSLFEKTLIKDFKYINTSSYERDNQKTLLPLDFIQFHNDKIDLGIFCVEVHDTNFNIVSSCPLKIYSDNNIDYVEVGDSLYNDDDDDESDDDDDDGKLRMSTVKDTNGNVYCIKADISIEDVMEYIKKENYIEPTNLSKYSHYNSNNSDYEYVNKVFNSNEKVPKKKEINKPIPSENTFSSFKCYIKGFFVTNYFSPSITNINQPDPEMYHTNMVWLNQLTLVNFISNNNHIDKIQIGDFITVTYDSITKDYKLSINGLGDEKCAYSCLPISSIFMKQNLFTGIEYSILSIENYFNN